MCGASAELSGCVASMDDSAMATEEDLQPSSSEATAVEECSKREVRWMASGEVVCSVPAGSASCLSGVEATVQAKAGVPVREQRLFLDGQELPPNASLACASAAAAPLMLVRTVSDPRVTDLSYFHPPADFNAVPVQGFTMVRKISEGINGDIFRYRCDPQHLKDVPAQFNTLESPADMCVAVKKLRNNCLKCPSNIENNERAVHLEPWKNSPPEEDALTEIGVLLYLSKQQDLSKYLIRMLGCFSDLRHTWLVTEFADGGELFHLVASSGLGGDRVRRYSWELLRAVGYLHRHQIGHRDISLENALIKDDSVKLMDFGVAVRSHTTSGVPLRYFRAAGKNFYRAPECYVPLTVETRVVAPVDSQAGDIVMVKTLDGYLCEVRLPPNAVPGRSCKAEVWGYAVQPVDIFAAGMAICILCCGFPIWQKALLVDPTFAYVHSLGEEGLSLLLQRWQKPLPAPGALQLLAGMLRTTAPSERLSAEEALASSWFDCLNEPAAGKS